jgi:phosphoglycerate dehydrogenase-like enzyme
MSAPGDGAATISRRSWPYELEDKTLSIVGAGNIGKKVARLTQAFHMRVRYCDVDRLGGDAEDALGARFALCPELLKISDIVSLHVPLDTTTPN